MSSVTWHPFRWEGAQLGNRFFPHAAIFISGSLPTLDGLSGWFQFDLGAPTSVLYGRAFSPEQRAHVEAHPHPPKPVMFSGQEVPLLHVPIRVGPWEVEPVIYLEHFGDTDAMDDGRPILGTVGCDLVREHILVIDFPGQRLSRLETLPPAWEKQTHWAPLRLSQHGHVIMQITVNGAPRWAGYDSGSSLFHLLTAPKQWQELSTGEVTESFPISAWGKSVEVHAGPSHAAFALGGQPLPVPIIHYLEGEAQQRFLEQNDLIGILGNAPFLENALILDFPRDRCGLLDATAL